MSFVNDTFTEGSDTDIASHVSDSGNHWAYSDIDVGIDSCVVSGGSGHVTPSSGGGSTAIYSTDDAPSSADYSVQIIGKLGLLALQNILPVYARTNHTAAIGYYFELRFDGSWNLVSIADSASISGSINGFDITIEHTILIQVIGSSITGFIDGVQVGQLTNSSTTAANHIGFGLVGNISSLDSTFYITSLTATILAPLQKTHRDVVLIGVK